MRFSAPVLAHSFRKIFSVVFVSIFLFLLSSLPSHAQSSYNHSLAPGVENNQHTRAQTALYDVLSAVSCIATGIDPINAKGCLAFDPTIQKFTYVPSSDTMQVGGALGFATNSIAGLYNMPISSVSYMQYVASDFGIAPSAHAQGLGFTQLRGVLPVWVIFRNLAYLLFVFVFALIGLGVMLRVKIDPRTVMTIQNQIPKIIIGLILITFSYAIAGLMVDVMWLTTYTTVRLVGQAKDPANQPFIESGKTTRDLLSSPIGFFNGLTEDVTGGACAHIKFGDNQPWGPGNCQNGIVGVAASVSGTIGGIIGNILSPFDDVAASCVSWNGVDVRACVHEAVYGVFKFIAQLIAFFIIAFALLIALFRIWWSLLKSFAYIVIYTTLAPMYIVGGLIPGSSTNFTSWFRALTANLAVYPATVGFLLGAKIFLKSFNETPFSPPLAGNPAATGGFGFICAFAIIMVTPELINMLRDALKSPPSKYIAPSIQAGLGRGAIIPGGVARGAWGRLWRYDYTGKASGTINSYLADRFGTANARWTTPLPGGAPAPTPGRGRRFVNWLIGHH